MKKCPKCGHEMVKNHPHPIYPKGSWVCPMNMPYQGCGYYEQNKT